MFVTNKPKGFADVQHYQIRNEVYSSSIVQRDKVSYLKTATSVDPVSDEGESVVQRVLGIAPIESEQTCPPGSSSTRKPRRLQPRTPTTVRKSDLGGRCKPEQGRDCSRVAAERLKTIKMLERRLQDVQVEEQFFRWVNNWAVVQGDHDKEIT
jgi:hypothetical protein